MSLDTIILSVPGFRVHLVSMKVTLLCPIAITAMAVIAASGQQSRRWDQRLLRRQLSGGADRAVQNVNDLRIQSFRPGMDGGEGDAAESRHGGASQRYPGRRFLE